MRRDEHVARLDDRELLGEVDVEAVQRPGRVREQRGVLGGGILDTANTPAEARTMINRLERRLNGIKAWEPYT